MQEILLSHCTTVYTVGQNVGDYYCCCCSAHLRIILSNSSKLTRSYFIWLSYLRICSLYWMR